MASQQLSMFLTDYEQRSDARDMAAYRALGAMSAAICLLRQAKGQDALSILLSALERYELADRELQKIKIHNPIQENSHAVHTRN